ncbi:MAG: PAC2 family protein [Dehalococcoidia bacterium]|nr:PAC2 family protein [Chloroflexota bacterium]MCK4242419.1 PAC2 family protein [Dehalococcoidia bacterium]
MPARAQLKIHRKPQLKNPRLILAWGSVGDVGIEAVAYLRDKLGAREFGHIEPYDFFDPSIEVANGLVELEFPQSKFYYWKNGDGDDLILFIADYEPQVGRYEYANLLLEVGQRFHVPRIYTIWSFPSLTSHTEEPRVFGVVNDAKLVPYLEQHPVIPIRERDLISMNGLVLSLAREKGFQGIYLLAEVPHYATGTYPKSCRAVLRVLTAMLGIGIALDEFDPLIEQAEEEMDEMAKKASWAFLEDFTIDYGDLFKEEEH